MYTNVSIKNKIFILFIMVISISVSIVGWYGFKSAKDSYIESALSINKGETKALSNEIKGVLGTIPYDVIYNANFYALEKLLVWEDLKEKKKIEKWKNIYISALKDYILNKKLYYQVRILDLEGNERILLKYDENTNTIIQTVQDKLQNKYNRDYFKEAVNLKKGEFYISEMTLNIENGQIEKPYVPVVRYSTPLIDANGQTKGVIVLNFNANYILEEIATAKSVDVKRDVQKYYLLNENGYYLFIGDKSKRWGFQLGSDYNFNKDYPNIIGEFKDKDQTTFIKNGRIFSMHKVYPNKADNKYRFWYLVTELNENVALSSLDTFVSVFFIILFSVLTLGLLLINGYISKLMNPLTKVTSQLKALSSGEIKKEDITYRANDEIGQIVSSTTILVDAIETTINQAKAVSNGDFTQDIKLLSSNDKLGLAITDMTKRLKEISALASSLSVGNYDVQIVARSSEDQLGLALIDMVRYLETVTQITESIAIGELDVKYKVQGSEDRLGHAILQMIKYLKTILNQANAISKEDFSKTIKAKSHSDELGIALGTMTDLLRINSVKNKEEIWFSDGIGEFSDKLTGIDDTVILAKQAITMACRYVGASSGVLYILDKEVNELSLISSFSYTQRDHLSNKFKIGDGVVGQVALEKEPILLKNIRNEEFEIQSGTTISKPKEVFAFPLIHDGELFGVAEMMSFEEFTSLHKDYLSKVANIFATALHTTIQNVQIKNLLEESQRAFEELQTKSEEMQAQSEELRSSNEQMEEQQQQLQIQSANLKIKNVEIEKAKTEIDKKASDLEASNQYKSEFLANMSHELRTPLNSVILLSSLLAKNNKENLSQSDIQKANVINESGNELLRLINDILDLSKIESGKMELIVDEIDSNNLVQHYTEIFKHTAEDKNLEFKVIDNINGVFYNDKDRLGQIIRNLVSNAFKFTREGSIILKLENTQDINLPIRISVIDTGLGIPKDKQELIFKAFTQADGSTSRQFGGTGLGLSISKELAHLMQGEIELESVEGEGATFSILLPNLKNGYGGEVIKIQRQRTEPIKSSDSIINRKENLTIKKEQFLIIEDDKAFANILKQIIEDNNNIAFVANNGQDGLKLSTEHKFDGAIVDIGLPDISGIDVIKRLKENPITSGIHIQVISGLSRDEQDLEDLEIDGYLQKPVSSEQINSTILNLENINKDNLKSILIVEDDISHLNAIKDFIAEDNDLIIVTASSIHEAKKVIEHKYFDIAIVDLGLSDGSGSEICRILNETKKDTSVLIYTGRDLSMDEADFLNDISDEIIIKNPNSHERLKDEISRFLTIPHLTVNDRFKAHIEAVDYSNVNVSDLKNKKVLIVDDDIKNIFVLSSALQEHDMKISHAKNGQEALDFLKDNADTNIVLMDIMMPIMDGYEAMEAIRKDESLKHLPIIAVTAKAMDKDREDALKSGADDYLTKPIDLEQLSSMMAMWINK